MKEKGNIKDHFYLQKEQNTAQKEHFKKLIQVNL